MDLRRSNDDDDDDPKAFPPSLSTMSTSPDAPASSVVIVAEEDDARIERATRTVDTHMKITIVENTNIIAISFSWEEDVRRRRRQLVVDRLIGAMMVGSHRFISLSISPILFFGRR
jgi:hypothetical protein